MWSKTAKQLGRRGELWPWSLKRRRTCCLWCCSDGWWESQQRGLGCAQCGPGEAVAVSGVHLAGQHPPQGGPLHLVPRPGSPGLPHALISPSWGVVPRTPPCRLPSRCPSHLFHLNRSRKHVENPTTVHSSTV